MGPSVAYAPPVLHLDQGDSARILSIYMQFRA